MKLPIKQFILKSSRADISTEMLGLVDFAQSMVNAEDYEGAYQTYNSLLARVESNTATTLLAEIQNWLGIISEQLGRYDKAVRHYQSALALLGNYPQSRSQVHINIGDIYSHEMRTVDAFSEYENAIKLLGQTPEDRQLRELIQKRILSLGVASHHLASMMAALETDEPTSEYLRQRAHTYMSLSEWVEAEKSVRQAIDLSSKTTDPKLRAILYNDLAHILSQQNNINDAIEAYSVAIETSSAINDRKTLAVTHNNLGLLFKDIKNYEQALRHLTESLKMKEEGADQNLSNTLYNLASVYLEMKLYESALSNIHRAIELDRQNKDEVSLHQDLELLSKVQRAQTTSNNG